MPDQAQQHGDETDPAQQDDAPPSRLERWILRVAYDGTDYRGWQRITEAPEFLAGSGEERFKVKERFGEAAAFGKTESSNQGLNDLQAEWRLPHSVQGQVDAALAKVFRVDPVCLKTVGSSRTDRGVHAKGQVCHFDVAVDDCRGAEEMRGGITESAQQDDAPSGRAVTVGQGLGKKKSSGKKPLGPIGLSLEAPAALQRLRRILPSGIQAVALAKARSGPGAVLREVVPNEGCTDGSGAFVPISDQRDDCGDRPRPALFHARLSARSKLYHYRLATSRAPPDVFQARYCWHTGPLDLPLLQRAIALFNNRPMDYSKAFTTHEFGREWDPYHGDRVKTVHVKLLVGGTTAPDEHDGMLAACEHDGIGGSCHRPVVLLLQTGDHFLYKMCRRIVGCLVAIATKKMKIPVCVEDIRGEDVPTAPACGLCLERVEYGDGHGDADGHDGRTVVAFPQLLGDEEEEEEARVNIDMEGRREY